MPEIDAGAGRLRLEPILPGWWMSCAVAHGYEEERRVAPKARRRGA